MVTRTAMLCMSEFPQVQAGGIFCFYFEKHLGSTWIENGGEMTRRR